MSFDPWKPPASEGNSVSAPIHDEAGNFTWYWRFRVLMLAGAFFWPLLGFVSLFAFDAPGSEKDIRVWAMVAPIWAYPFVAFICSAAAGILKRKGNARGATFLMGIPATMAGIFFALVLGSMAYAVIAER